MFPALNVWTFPSELSARDLIQAAADAGAKGVELAPTAEGPFSIDAPQRELRDLVSLAANLDIRITGLVAVHTWQFNFASPDAADRRKSEELTLRMLDQAAALGAGAVLIIPAVVGKHDESVPRVSYADALQATSQALSRLRHEAEARRVALAIENVWNRFLLSPVETADLIDRADSPWVGVYFDVGNVMPFGYPQDWIETLGGRIVRVHLKDYDLSVPGAGGFCALGEGSVDWTAVMRALRTVGYDGPLTYEGGGDPADVIQRIERIMDGRPASEGSNRA